MFPPQHGLFSCMWPYYSGWLLFCGTVRGSLTCILQLISHPCFIFWCVVRMLFYFQSDFCYSLWLPNLILNMTSDWWFDQIFWSRLLTLTIARILIQPFIKLMDSPEDSRLINKQLVRTQEPIMAVLKTKQIYINYFFILPIRNSQCLNLWCTFIFRVAEWLTLHTWLW